MAIATQQNEILDKIKTASGLLRISTDKTDYSGKKVDFEATLKNHEEKLSSFFDEQGWQKNFYREVLSGGTDYEDRPELVELLNNIQSYDAIVVMELQRLARQGYVSQLIKKQCEKYQVYIITLNPFKIYDLSRNLNDSFLFDISSSMGEYERKVASVRVKANKISMARQGLNSSGSVPYGYERNPQTKKLEIVPEQAKIVEMIFEWYLQGDGQKTICDRLNSMGIRNKQGNLWINQSMRYLLTCPTYKGTLVANNFENEKGKMIATETVVKDENHPYIIAPEVWEKAQSLRKRKREKSGVDSRIKDRETHAQNMNILSGLIECGCCGRKSIIKWYGERKFHHIIKCNKYNASGITCNNGGISAKDIEKMVFEKLLSYKEEIEERISKFSVNDFEDRIKDLEERKDLLEKRLKILENQARAIRQQEQSYIMSEVEDEFEAEAIAEDKANNQANRLAIKTQLRATIEQLMQAPSAGKEIEKLEEKLDIIKQLQNRDDLTVQNVNVMLKQIISIIKYKRELPDNYRNMASARKNEFPAFIEIKYND